MSKGNDLASLKARLAKSPKAVLGDETTIGKESNSDGIKELASSTIYVQALQILGVCAANIAKDCFLGLAAGRDIESMRHRIELIRQNLKIIEAEVATISIAIMAAEEGM